MTTKPSRGKRGGGTRHSPGMQENDDLKKKTSPPCKLLSQEQNDRHKSPWSDVNKAIKDRSCPYGRRKLLDMELPSDCSSGAASPQSAIIRLHKNYVAPLSHRTIKEWHFSEGKRAKTEEPGESCRDPVPSNSRWGSPLLHQLPPKSYLRIILAWVEEMAEQLVVR